MVTLKINGESHTVDAPSDMPLLWILRDLLGMNGTKFGCGAALRAAFAVHLDGIPKGSCVIPVDAETSRAVGAGNTLRKGPSLRIDMADRRSIVAEHSARIHPHGGSR
jgi:aerobic-type carbon monoxide dehydrogenase small subunit (CoxS/CutS family)